MWVNKAFNKEANLILERCYDTIKPDWGRLSNLEIEHGLRNVISLIYQKHNQEPTKSVIFESSNKIYIKNTDSRVRIEILVNIGKSLENRLFYYILRYRFGSTLNSWNNDGHIWFYKDNMVDELYS